MICLALFGKKHIIYCLTLKTEELYLETQLTCETIACVSLPLYYQA